MATIEDQTRLLQSKFADTADGHQVVIKYVHIRDQDTVRQLKGALRKTGDATWVVKVSPTKVVTIPNGDAIIISAESLNREPSIAINRIDAEDDIAMLEVEPLVAQQRPPATNRDPPLTPVELQRRPPQPSGTEDMGMMNDPVMLRRMLYAMTNATTQQQPQPVMHTNPLQVMPGMDVTQTFVAISDALRGQDSPTYRLCPGILMQRNIQPMFALVSIPHLLFEDSDATSTMLKRDKGEAIKYYNSLVHYKSQYPNQVLLKFATKPGDKKQLHQQGVLSSDAASGVRAELERAERMFISLLQQLDAVDQHELPKSKSDWLLYIDAGVNVLSCYATLANGFVKGGAKISCSYKTAIFAGKWNPGTLWTEAENEFRKKE